MNIIFLLLKTSCIFIVLLFIARILGKKQLSQLTFFNYITGITIGSVAANMINETDGHFVDGLVGIIWWCALTELTGYINLKSGTIRRIIDGEPTIIIKKGSILKQSLRSTRINLDDLSMLLREEGVFSISEVDYAILEPDGKLSVLKKQNKDKVSKDESVRYLPSEIISDGKIIKRNLYNHSLDEEWLMKQLIKYNISDVCEIFYAELEEDGKLYVQKQN